MLCYLGINFSRHYEIVYNENYEQKAKRIRLESRKGKKEKRKQPPKQTNKKGAHTKTGKRTN